MEELQKKAFEMEIAGFMNRQWLPLTYQLSKDEFETYYKKFKLSNN